MGRLGGSARGSTSHATALLFFALGCGATPPSRSLPSTAHTQATPSFASDGAEIFGFPEATGSPLAVAHVPRALEPFFDQCKLGDAALARVAERFARRQSEGSAPLDVSEISFALR